jgi:hypothetical protein
MLYQPGWKEWVAVRLIDALLQLAPLMELNKATQINSSGL